MTLKGRHLTKADLANFKPRDTGSLHPDELSPLTTLRELLTPKTAQLYKQREVWGPSPETMARRIRERARNNALKNMTSLDAFTRRSLFEIALLRAVLVESAGSGCPFEQTFRTVFGYVLAVAPGFRRFGESASGLKKLDGFLEGAKAQLIRDGRIKENPDGTLRPTGESSPWFDKWRNMWKAAAFSAPPSANEQSLFSPVDPDNQVLRLEEDALVEHPEWGVGRIKKVLLDGRVWIRFRLGPLDQYCRPEELSPAF